MSTLRLSDLVGGELKIQKEVKLTSGPVSVKIWLPRDSAKTLDAAKSLVQYEMGARHVKHLVIATDADETIIAATSRVRSDSQYLREISGSCTMIRDLLQEYTGRVDLAVRRITIPPHEELALPDAHHPLEGAAARDEEEEAMVRRGHLHVRRDRLLEPLRARRALAHDVHRLLQLHVVRAELTQRAAGEKVEALLQ